MCFSCLDDEGRARHLMVISRNNYQREANLLYLKNKTAQITSISRLFSDITKLENHKDFCLRCLGHFSSQDVHSRHKELCT